MLNANTLLQYSTVAEAEQTPPCKHPQVFTGLEPCSAIALSGTLPRWHRSLPQTGNTPFILAFRRQALPWAQFAEFSLPYSHANPSRPLSHGFTDSSFCCFCSFQNHQSIDSLRLFVLEWLLSPFALYLVGSCVHELRYEWTRSLPHTVAPSQSLELAQRTPWAPAKQTPASLHGKHYIPLQDMTG
jgi:hypothetical protein